MKLRVYPDPILRTIASSVEKVTTGLASKAHEMLLFMEENGGIGLAAQQVGIEYRIITINTKAVDRKFGFRGVMFNPEILSVTEETLIYAEGCLSFPNERRGTKRAMGIVVKYLDENGKSHQNTFLGITSICIQHEIDHLNGKLFIDEGVKI